MITFRIIKGHNAVAVAEYMEDKKVLIQEIISNAKAKNIETNVTSTAEYYDSGGGFKAELTPIQIKRLFESKQVKSIAEKYAILKGRDRIGIDFTYSFTKDVSLLALIGDDNNVRSIIQDEIRNTMNKMQSYIETRAYDEDGNRIRVKAEAYMSMFEHHTTRSLDPELHYHIFVSNQVVREGDNKLTAIEAKRLIENLNTITFETNYQLAQRLQEKGYSAYLSSDNGSLRLTEDRGLIEAFSSRRQQMQEKAKELFNTDDLSSLSRKQLQILALSTRPDKQRIDDIRDLKDLWKQELMELGYSKESFLNSTKLREPPTQQLSADDIEKAFDMVVRYYDEKEGIVEKNRIYRQFLIKVSEISREENKKLIELDTLKIHFENHLQKLTKFQDNDKEYYATHEYVYEERKALSLFKELAQREKTYYMHPEIQKAVREYEKSKGFELSEDQKAVLSKFDKSQLLLINGHAGTGKTTVMEVIKMAADRKGLNLIGLAPTGKAAEELQKALGKGKTIDSFLLKTKNEIKQIENSIIIVDEAGMVDTRKMKELLEIAKQTNSKIVLQGDYKQIKAVQAGDFMRDAYEIAKNDSKIKENSFAELTNIRRQKQAEYRELTILFSEKKYSEAIQKMIENKDRYFADFDIQKIKESFMKDSQNTLIVASTNNLKDELNRLIRAELKEQNKLQKSITVNTSNTFEVRTINDLRNGDEIRLDKTVYTIAGITEKGMKVLLYDPKTQRTIEANFSDIYMKQAVRREEKEFSIGDRIITTKNEKSLNVKNGELWYVRGIDENGKLVLENDQKKIKINPNQYNHIDHAYSITVHKSQGMTTENIIIADRDNNMNANLFYVALTRGKQDMKIFTNNVVETLFKSQQEQKKITMSLRKGQNNNDIIKRNDIAEQLILKDKSMFNKYAKYIDDLKQFLTKLQNEKEKVKLGKEPVSSIKESNSMSEARRKIEELKRTQEEEKKKQEQQEQKKQQEQQEQQEQQGQQEQEQEKTQQQIELSL